MGITVLLHGDKDGAADTWPGGRKGSVSGNGVVGCSSARPAL